MHNVYYEMQYVILINILFGMAYIIVGCTAAGMAGREIRAIFSTYRVVLVPCHCTRTIVIASHGGVVPETQMK